MDAVLMPQENRESADNTGNKKNKSSMILKNFLYLLLLVLIIGGTIYGIRTNPEILGLTRPDESSEEVSDLVSKVNEIIQLPAGEIPTLATVSDLEKVKDQPFFKNANIGDKVLVYQNAKKAYLYRPSQNKIIEVGVVNTVPSEGDVAGDSNDIQVISPTPLPLETPVPSQTEALPTATVQPRPTTSDPSIYPSP